ncbi:hypothetical protein [Peptostreptococcus faecalis]|uniref:hypothetical protein n=1 Tax=Peptostreptococcus faecalis TaxID=2045015 RepID=UPI000C7BAC4F|nr:hypothetical protein [Peptostreptococcus faecalis]
MFENNYKLILFKSRNKDNRELEGFKERGKTLLLPDIPTMQDWEILEEQWIKFIEEGVDGEMSRWYEYIDLRDGEKIRKELIHHLIDFEDTRLDNIMRKIKKIAGKPNMAITKKFLFDLDNIKNNDYSHDFTNDLVNILGSDDLYEIYQTPNGFSVVTPHGFDTRKLLAKYPNVELKRNALIIRQWERKGEQYEYRISSCN